jgi:hypothetical protein
MRTREELVDYATTRGIANVLCWGRVGQAAVDFIEHGLGFELPEELRSFAISIGNVHIEGSSIIITGNRASGAEYSCITETSKYRDAVPDAHPRIIRIGNHYDKPLLWENGLIREYLPFDHRKPHQMADYGTIDLLIDALIEDELRFQAE